MNTQEILLSRRPQVALLRFANGNKVRVKTWAGAHQCNAIIVGRIYGVKECYDVQTEHGDRLRIDAERLELQEVSQ